MIERVTGRTLGLLLRPLKPLAYGFFRFVTAVSRLSERFSILSTPFITEFGIAAFDQKRGIFDLRKLINGSMISLDISEKTQRSIYSAKVYERNLTRFVVAHLTGGDTFIDIGANVGYFTLLAAQAVGSAGRVVACEPEHENFKLLERNIELNHYENVTPLRVAIGEGDGEVTLNINPLNRGGNSVLPFNEYHSGKHYYKKDDIERRFGPALQQRVPIKSLDGLISENQLAHIKIIKIDVEGYEEAVIKGAENILKDRVAEYFICELSNKETRGNIIDTFKQSGYDACAMGSHGDIERTTNLGRDVLFVRTTARDHLVL